MNKKTINKNLNKKKNKVNKNTLFKLNDILKKSFLIYLVLILLFSNVINIHQSFAADLPISCEAAIVYEMNTNEILYEKNIHKKMYPASLTKFLTGLLAIENGNINDLIIFNKEATTLEPGSSTLQFRAGEEITLNNALYGLMIRSANEIGNQLTYYIKEKTTLDYKDAAKKKLQEIGANESNFISPTGLHEDNHYTTAYDLALIAKAAYKNETFRKYFSTVSYTIPATNLHDEREIYSTHKMMFTSSPYHLNSIIGGKTGTTFEAGNTLITFAEKDGMLIVVVVLKGNGTDEVCEDTYNLINYSFDKYETKHLFKKDTTFAFLPLVNNYEIEEGKISLKASDDFYITLLKTETDKYSIINNNDNKIEKNNEEKNSNEDENDNHYDNVEAKLNEENQNSFNEYTLIIPSEDSNSLFTFTSNLPDKINTSIIEGQVIGNITFTSNTGYEKNISIISNTTQKLKSDHTYDITTICSYLVIGTAVALIIFVIFFIKACFDEKNVSIIDEESRDKYGLTTLNKLMKK